MRQERVIDWMKRELVSCRAWAEGNQTCKRKGVGVSLVRLGTTNHSPHLILRGKNGPSSKGHECSNVVGNCGCSHAEPRAILNYLRKRGEPKLKPGLILLSTYSPCTNCANIINDSGIIRAVIYDIRTEHDTRGIDLLFTHDIIVSQVSYLENVYDRLAQRH